MTASLVFGLILFAGISDLGVVGTVLKTARQESGHGRLSSEISVRMINGENARPHEFPWQVSMRLRRNNRHICGGSLISRYLVLTAAHCVLMNPCFSKYSVVLGAHKRKGNTIFQQYRKVKRWYVHSYYSADHYKKDIALLRLDRPVKMTRAVHPISLPQPGSRVAAGTRCFMSGWGKTRNNGAYSSFLQKTLLPIVRYQFCAKRNNRLFKVDNHSMVCAGGRGRTGGCRGDSGGPLSCWERGRWTLRGVVSWGHKKCRTDYYTVFTRVSSLVNWIIRTARRG